MRFGDFLAVQYCQVTLSDQQHCGQAATGLLIKRINAVGQS